MPEPGVIWDQPIPDGDVHPLWKQATLDSNPEDQLPATINGSATGHPFLDAFIEHVNPANGPLNPSNWLDIIKNSVKGPFTQESFDQADRLIKASEKTGNMLPILTGKEDGTLGEYAGGLAGDAAQAAVLGTLAHGLSKIPKMAERLTYADPSKDLINVYKPSDPRFPERSPNAIADIKNHAPVMITSNEHLASTSPTQVVSPALQANRQAMDAWHQPVQQRGFTAQPTGLLRATEDSIKKMADPARRADILNEAQHQIMQQPLSPDRLKSLLEEKNGELSAFYSKDEAVREAAKQAGASTGRSQALLEAQAQAIRDEYYKLLDPQNGGAGPREIQRRYGAIKMLQDEASNGPTRNRILGETGGTPISKATKSVLGVADLAGAPFKEGGLAEGFKGVKAPFSGKSDPLIARAFRNAPDYQPLPQAPPIEQRYPAPPMSQPQPPNPGRALPPASTFIQGEGTEQGTRPGSGLPSSPSRTLPNKTDASYVRSVNAEPAKAEMTPAARNNAEALQRFGKGYGQLSKQERNVIDKIRNGTPLTISDLSNLR